MSNNKKINVWNKFFTSPIHSSTFILGELCYRGVTKITESITGVPHSYACYLSRENNVLSEHINYGEDFKKGIFGAKYFSNKKNVSRYFEKTYSIIRLTEQFKEKIENLDFSFLNKKQILDLVLSAEKIYYDSDGYYFISQPEYTEKLRTDSILKLKKFVPEKKVSYVFSKLIESEKESCLELERKDWLRYIVIPFLEKKLSCEELDNLILSHTNKYKYFAKNGHL